MTFKVNNGNSMNKTKEEILQDLQEIRNIGPKMALKLYEAGIYDLKTIKRIGTEDVYLMVDESGGFCGTHHAAYLYAIEAAIIDCAWQDVPANRKIELKEFTKNLRGYRG